MRLIALTAIAAFIAAPTMASSIEVITGTRLGNGSMVNLDCPTCPPLKPAANRSTYVVPTLEDGVQKEEILSVNGEKTIVRTDKWMGGSPSVFHQKLTPETEAAMSTKPVIGADVLPVAASMIAPDGVDPTATTAAVSAEPVKPAGDFSGFELRLR